MKLTLSDYDMKLTASRCGTFTPLNIDEVIPDKEESQIAPNDVAKI